MSEIENKPKMDPKSFKLGIFYYNPNDKRIIVPKRIPTLGWTLNFAKPISYLILLPIVIIVLAAIFTGK